MRALILASVAAAAFAAPALAAPSGSSATANYNMNVAEDCTFDTGAVPENTALVLTARTIANTDFTIDVDCNVEFSLRATDETAGGTLDQVTMSLTSENDTVEGEYKTTFVGAVERAITEGEAGTGTGGNSFKGQDLKAKYTVKWADVAGGSGTKSGGLAAGDWAGALVITLAGKDLNPAPTAIE